MGKALDEKSVDKTGWELIMHSTIQSLLKRLQDINVNDPAVEQEVLPAETTGRDTIATLEIGTVQPVSPFLKSRFAYCGTWVEAFAGQTWLSLEQIAKFQDDATLVRRVRLRAENFEGFPPVSTAPGACAIFGYSPFDTDETYLVWQRGVSEPQVWTFTGGDSKKFSDLERFLEYIVGDRFKDDS